MLCLAPIADVLCVRGLKQHLSEGQVWLDIWHTTLHSSSYCFSSLRLPWVNNTQVAVAGGLSWSLNCLNTFWGSVVVRLGWRGVFSLVISGRFGPRPFLFSPALDPTRDQYTSIDRDVFPIPGMTVNMKIISGIDQGDRSLPEVNPTFSK